MKKTALAIIICILAAALSFAEEQKTVKKDYNLVSAPPTAITGTVKAVMSADLARPEAGLAITDESGNQMDFTLRANAVIYNSSDGSLMSVKDLITGEKVQVNYDVVNGVNYATAIKTIAPEEATRKALPEGALPPAPKMEEKIK